MNKSVFNFSAGPATLPQEILEKVGKEIINYQSQGFSILETSHRSKKVTEIFEETKEKLLNLLNLNKEKYQVLFLHGGASTAFYQIPMNLLSQDQTADYLETGSWAKKAIKEAKYFGNVHIASTSKEDNFKYIPTEDQINYSHNPKYIYLCSNNTIFGTQYQNFPIPPHNFPLIGDFSSDILCRHLERLDNFGIIFAGTQKNLAPAGMAVVIIRKDILSICNKNVPSMCSYKVHSDNNSLYNTPPVFVVYFLKYVLEWIERQGGLKIIEANNRKKASLIYNIIDQYEFYTGAANKKDRSIMNITFTLPSEELSDLFLKEAESLNLLGLKGHRSVGGIRASMYNAFPLEGAEKLANLMENFAKKNE